MKPRDKAKQIIEYCPTLLLLSDLAEQIENAATVVIAEAVAETERIAIAEERQACALLADYARLPAWQQPVPMQEGCRWARREIGDAIRARGNNTTQAR